MIFSVHAGARAREQQAARARSERIGGRQPAGCVPVTKRCRNSVRRRQIGWRTDPGVERRSRSTENHDTHSIHRAPRCAPPGGGERGRHEDHGERFYGEKAPRLPSDPHVWRLPSPAPWWTHRVIALSARSDRPKVHYDGRSRPARELSSSRRGQGSGTHPRTHDRHHRRHNRRDRTRAHRVDRCSGTFRRRASRRTARGLRTGSAASARPRLRRRRRRPSRSRGARSGEADPGPASAPARPPARIAERARPTSKRVRCRRAPPQRRERARHEQRPSQTRGHHTLGRANNEDAAATDLWAFHPSPPPSCTASCPGSPSHKQAPGRPRGCSSRVAPRSYARASCDRARPHVDAPSLHRSSGSSNVEVRAWARLGW